MSKRKSYTLEQKLAAIKMITDGGVSLSEASVTLCISESNLRRWQSAYLASVNTQDAKEGANTKPLDGGGRMVLQKRIFELEDENKKLKELVDCFARQLLAS